MRMLARLGLFACCAMLAPVAAFAVEPPKAEPAATATPAPAPTPTPTPKTQAEIEQEAKLKANMKAGTDALLAEFGVKPGSLPGDKPKAKAGPTAPTPPKAPAKPTITLAPSGG